MNQSLYFSVIPEPPGIREPRMLMTYYVYILASRRNGTLYTGVTNDLKRRIFEHKNDIIEGFTKDHKVHDLVYYESTNDINVALSREKALKKWDRAWKIQLIAKNNPEWSDLPLE